MKMAWGKPNRFCTMYFTSVDLRSLLSNSSKKHIQMDAFG